mmetsp:Transcript_381/g.1294  ORF Transcript_381/g.1294 Transcript_381/m.1294 type:complete len:218 (+) Transcript_381:530-1183(+)
MDTQRTRPTCSPLTRPRCSLLGRPRRTSPACPPRTRAEKKGRLRRESRTTTTPCRRTRFSRRLRNPPKQARGAFLVARRPTMTATWGGLPWRVPNPTASQPPAGVFVPPKPRRRSWSGEGLSIFHPLSSPFWISSALPPAQPSSSLSPKPLTPPPRPRRTRWPWVAPKRSSPGAPAWSTRRWRWRLATTTPSFFSQSLHPPAAGQPRFHPTKHPRSR